MKKTRKAAGKASPDPLVRWEYDCVQKKIGEPGFDWADLQRMGRDGWECCGFMGAFWLFKRQLRTPNKELTGKGEG